MQRLSSFSGPFMIASNLPIINDKGRKVNIFWFRRDLRLEDNAGLYHALNGNNKVLPIFIFDRAILKDLEDKKDRRVQFIHKSLCDIQKKLKESGSSLFVIHGEVQDIMDALVQRLNIEAVYANHDYEPYARKRDEHVKALLNRSSIDFKTFKDQVVFEKNDVLKPDGEPYTIYTPYRKKWQELLRAEDIKSYPSEDLIDHFLSTKPQDLPGLESLGFRTSNESFPTKEIDENLIKTYHKNRDYPALDATTRLSVHFRFGTVSIRKQVRKALELNETWLGELIWREFFMMILYHFPRVVDHCFKTKYEAVKWRNNPDEFSLWCEGKTGYPIVDAGMRELNQTGYMHNRVRMVTASFLTKHLLIDWRWGERYFAKKLLDYDLSANNGNWQWAAGCGCDAAPYFRIFNPYTQQEKFDRNREYIKKWVPEQDTEDYPGPMVNHKMARERALSAYSVVKK